MRVYEKMKELAENNGKSITGVLREAGIAANVGTGWKSGRTPSLPHIKAVASVLGISVDELLAGTEGYEQIPSVSVVQNGNSNTQNTFIHSSTAEETYAMELFRELAPEQKKLVIRFMLGGCKE